MKRDEIAQREQVCYNPVKTVIFGPNLNNLLKDNVVTKSKLFCVLVLWTHISYETALSVGWE